MTALTAEQASEIKSILAALKDTIPRTAVALQGPTLLVEVQAWLRVYESLANRFDALELPMDLLATQAVALIDERPESIRLYDLDEIRGSIQIPDDPGGLTP